MYVILIDVYIFRQCLTLGNSDVFLLSIYGVFTSVKTALLLLWFIVITVKSLYYLNCEFKFGELTFDFATGLWKPEP